jgi:hypothetical protein
MINLNEMCLCSATIGDTGNDKNVKLTLNCGHTCEDYTVEVGTDKNCDKFAKTYFFLKVLDDDTGIEKEIEFTMQGGAERQILINLLKAAVEILETGKLEVTTNGNI